MKKMINLLASLTLFIATLTACSSPIEGSKAKISYYDNAQVEIICPGGSRVLINVFDPAKLSSVATERDILLTSHNDADHYNAVFAKSFTGKQLFLKAGSITLPDVTIRGIPSVYRPDDQPQEANGSNYIYLIETGGLRIVHFGAIGQNALTTEQVAILSAVDIAISQFDNVYSFMDIKNKKGLSLMDQVKPKLVIPTFNNAGLVEMEGKKWTPLFSNSQFVTIGPRDLTSQTQVLFLGVLAQTWAKRAQATKAAW